MSGINSPVPNYGGRQPDNAQYIKQFVQSSSNAAMWVYKTTTNNANTSYITPTDQTKDVLIPKDLIVIGSINNPSDVTLKENVEVITDTEFDNLLEIRPKKYSFIDDEAKKVHYGIIAQELEGLFPELVTTIGLESAHPIKTINYLELIPLMICKMQKMQQQIDQLKGDI